MLKCSGLMTFIYNSPLNLNIPKLSFRSNPAVYNPQFSPAKDGFATNPLYEKFGSKAEIELAAKSNPRINEIMKEHNIPIKVNIAELEKLKQGHLKDTRIVAAQIYSSLPQELKIQANPVHLQEAAMLHDYGKVLIPDSILNKNGKLTEDERKIMQQHSELGYELLKNKGLSQETLDLIKYHHQTPDGKGYPTMQNYTSSVDSQILNTADKYTALREKRAYKNPMGKYEALEIIAKDVNNGNISQDVYTALLKNI